MEKKRKVEFAIIGGGCAGLYTGWRLAKNKKQVILYEGTTRTGGRLLSARVPRISHPAELGGMRYTEAQILIKSLVQEFGLTAKDFKYETKLMYLRGRHITATQKSCDAFPYLLKEKKKKSKSQEVALRNETDQQREDREQREEREVRERDMVLSPKNLLSGPYELIRHALLEALTEIVWPQGQQPERELKKIKETLQDLKAKQKLLTYRSLTAKEWHLFKQYAVLRDSPMYDRGFWNLLQFYLSSEAFLFAHDGIGYESLVANWNAAEAIPWFLRDFDAPYKTIEKGMDEIPTQLGFRLMSAGGTIHLEHTLRMVEYDNDSGLKLSFETPEGDRTVYAENVILAVPQHALSQIRLKGFKNNENEKYESFDDLIEVHSVKPHPLFKLFLGYDRAWWQDGEALNATHGKAATDLPIRQVYYFAPEAADHHDGEADIPALLMASYSDEHYVDFWQPLYPAKDSKAWEKMIANLKEDEQTRLTKGQMELLKAYGASDNVLSKAHRLVCELHPKMNKDKIPEPFVGLLMNWETDPHRGGWHSWCVHERPWQVRQKIKQPLPPYKIYTCGEAYSQEQGWAEGAFRSSELVLKAIDPNFPEPDFVDNQEYSTWRFENLDDYIK